MEKFMKSVARLEWELYEYIPAEEIPLRIKETIECLKKAYEQGKKTGFRNFQNPDVSEYVSFLEDLHQCCVRMLDFSNEP